MKIKVAPLMGYLVLNPQQKVDLHVRSKILSLSYNMHRLPYLFNDSQTIHSTIHFSKPLLCVVLICDWSIPFHLPVQLQAIGQKNYSSVVWVSTAQYQFLQLQCLKTRDHATDVVPRLGTSSSLCPGWFCLSFTLRGGRRIKIAVHSNDEKVLQ